MREIALKTGTLLVKGDYVIVEETKTENSDYAAYIFENLGTTPKYIVFSEKPFEGISQTIVEDYFHKVAELYPEAKAVMDKHIPFVYGENRQVINQEESLKQPHFYMIYISDKEKDEHLDYGLGIVRREDAK